MSVENHTVLVGFSRLNSSMIICQFFVIEKSVALKFRSLVFANTYTHIFFIGKKHATFFSFWFFFLYFLSFKKTAIVCIIKNHPSFIFLHCVELLEHGNSPRRMEYWSADCSAEKRIFISTQKLSWHNVIGNYV